MLNANANTGRTFYFKAHSAQECNEVEISQKKVPEYMNLLTKMMLG